MTRVMVTGGCGYIGAHTIVELIESGYDVVSIDSNVRSSERILDGVHAITGRGVTNHPIDLRDGERLDELFREIEPVDAIIHFAAYKSVPESVREPLRYYDNNVRSLVNVLECVERHDVQQVVFSSSCSVYGNLETLPVTEETPLGEAESPYARTKQIGEKIIQDYARVSPAKFIALRYFNPVGAHDSALIGEVPYGKPENLVPAITQTGIGKIEQLVVHGNDYDTRDGTCIRDYVHVVDIARAHVLAVGYLAGRESGYDILNLGSGLGITVLEMITAFERASGVPLNYRIGPRRPGDVAAIYTENGRALELLGWRPERNVENMMSTAWKWELEMARRGDATVLSDGSVPAVDPGGS